jgi:hypothetical protein
VLHETGGASQALSLFPRSGSVCRQARGTRSCLIEQVCRTARCPDAASDPGRKLAFAVPVHSAGMPVRREGLVARACAPDITTAASATHKPVTSHSAHRPANGPPGALPDGAALTAITSPLPAGWVAYLMPTSYRANLRRPLRRCSGRVAEPGAHPPAWWRRGLPGRQGPGDTEHQVLLVAEGKIALVHPDVWEYDVGGMGTVRHWFNRRLRFARYEVGIAGRGSRPRRHCRMRRALRRHGQRRPAPDGGWIVYATMKGSHS